VHVSVEHVIEPDSGRLERLLGSPLTFEDHAPAEFEIVRLPDLDLPDGYVVAADGIILQGLPFTQRLAAGAHQLRLAVGLLTGGDSRVAFAILGASEAPIVRFELALTDCQNIATLEDGNVYGYPVDAGMGSFAPPRAHEALAAIDDLLTLTEPAMQSVYRHTRDWCTVTTAAGAGAIFSSGFGDGLYASYFGFDATGSAVVLVTDFSVVAWPRNPMPA